jgi:hypothetical protein
MAKCKHEACGCDLPGKEYCSKHCATAQAMEEEPTSCECGHITCKD